MTWHPATATIGEKSAIPAAGDVCDDGVPEGGFPSEGPAPQLLRQADVLGEAVPYGESGDEEDNPSGAVGFQLGAPA